MSLGGVRPRRWEVQGAFGVEHLSLALGEERPLRAGEIRVAVRAVSLNYRDLLVVSGRYDPRLRLPFVPVSDGVGVVVEVGDGVEGVEAGQRVAGLFAPRWIAGRPSRAALRDTLGAPGPGMLSERVVLPARAVVPVPDALSDEEAATLPCAALTAWSAVVEEGGIRAGARVLVLGTGGVAIFALQFARLLGARVAVTSSSPAKLERVRAMGAELCIDYTADPEWGRTVRRWADGGVDLVVEVGGAGTLPQSLAAVAPGGTVALIGVLAGSSAPIDLLPVLMNQVRVQGVFVGHRQGFEAMGRAIAASGLRPVVDRVFPFEEAPRAFAYLSRGAHFGKVCLRIGADEEG